MRILVTGAAGFLGQHVVRGLRNNGHTIWGIDEMPGFPCEGVTADITKPLELKGTVQKKFDAVIHLAAIASPNVCDADPSQAFNVNVNGTHQVLKLALETGAKKFVFVSSAHVYDIPPKYMPTDENHPLHLNNTYTTTKILGEKLCELYYQNHGLSYTTLRLFNVYGSGQATGYFIPDMIEKAKNGGIELKGGNTTKDFVYIDDVVRAFCAAVESPYVGPINIGTEIATRLDDMARQIAGYHHSPFTSIDVTEPSQMKCDYARARQVLGWGPTVSTADGLDEILNDDAKSQQKE